MTALRTAVDDMEKVCGHDYWPVPELQQDAVLRVRKRFFPQMLMTAPLAAWQPGALLYVDLFLHRAVLASPGTMVGKTSKQEVSHG
jgi:hypothetical protein